MRIQAGRGAEGYLEKNFLHRLYYIIKITLNRRIQAGGGAEGDFEKHPFK